MEIYPLTVGIDASYQAVPYEPLLERAMNDVDAAEALQFFGELATVELAHSMFRDDPVWLELSPIARRIVTEHPGILDRTLSTRAWDAVHWLLSPRRRAGHDSDPAGLAECAVFGVETFSRGARSTIGNPLRFVRPQTATALAEFLDTATGTAADLFDPAAMAEAAVYKAPWDRDHVLDELSRLARLYRHAGELGECVLVVHD